MCFVRLEAVGFGLRQPMDMLYLSGSLCVCLDRHCCGGSCLAAIIVVCVGIGFVVELWLVCGFSYFDIKFTLNRYNLYKSRED